MAEPLVCGKAGCGAMATWQGYVGCLKVLACDEHNKEIEGVIGGIGGVPFVSAPPFLSAFIIKQEESMKSREHYRQKLLKVYRKALKEVEDVRNTLEWWNNNRLDAPPMDVGGEKVAIVLLKDMLSLLERNENIPEELTARLQEQLEANAALEHEEAP